MSPKPILSNLFPLNLNGILKIWFSMGSGLPLVETNPLAFVLHMTVNSILLNMSPTTGLGVQRSSPKEILKENPKSNSREKSRNLEQERKEKFSPPEKQKPEPILRKLNKNSLRRSLLLDRLYLINLHNHNTFIQFNLFFNPIQYQHILNY